LLHVLSNLCSIPYNQDKGERYALLWLAVGRIVFN